MQFAKQIHYSIQCHKATSCCMMYSHCRRPPNRNIFMYSLELDMFDSPSLSLDNEASLGMASKLRVLYYYI
jgi:hypothetical protein